MHGSSASSHADQQIMATMWRHSMRISKLSWPLEPKRHKHDMLFINREIDIFSKGSDQVWIKSVSNFDIFSKRQDQVWIKIWIKIDIFCFVGFCNSVLDIHVVNIYSPYFKSIPDIHGVNI